MTAAIGTASVSTSLTESWTAEYRGLVIGSSDSPLSFTEIVGLLDAPAVRTADRKSISRHGEQSRPDMIGARTVTVTIEVNGNTDDEFERALSDVQAAFAVGRDVEPFVFRFPGVAGGGVRYVSAKVRKRSTPLDVAYAHNLATVAVELYCPSPLILDTVTQTGAAALPPVTPTGGGAEFPISFPLTFANPDSPATTYAVNAGNFEAFPVFRVFGPIDTPRIANLDTGEQLELQYTLLAGQWLEINTDTRDVLLNGTAPRFLTPGTRNTWLTVPAGTHGAPGVAQFGLSGSRILGETVEPRLECEWRSTWV